MCTTSTFAHAQHTPTFAFYSLVVLLRTLLRNTLQTPTKPQHTTYVISWVCANVLLVNVSKHVLFVVLISSTHVKGRVGRLSLGGALWREEHIHGDVSGSGRGVWIYTRDVVAIATLFLWLRVVRVSTCEGEWFEWRFHDSSLQLRGRGLIHGAGVVQRVS